MRTLLAMALAATLLSPVAASAQALEPPVQPKLNLTLQDRYTIKELIKDIRVTPAPGKQDVSIGKTGLQQTIRRHRKGRTGRRRPISLAAQLGPS
jgi:hypothetical protein